jgi:hypothetical protein
MVMNNRKGYKVKIANKEVILRFIVGIKETQHRLLISGVRI